MALVVPFRNMRTETASECPTIPGAAQTQHIHLTYLEVIKNGINFLKHLLHKCNNYQTVMSSEKDAYINKFRQFKVSSIEQTILGKFNNSFQS